MNLIIPQRAKNKEAALKFALFLTNKNNQVELAKLTTILPVNNESLKDPYFNQYNNNDTISKARYLSAQQLNNLQKQVKFKNNRKEIITNKLYYQKQIQKHCWKIRQKTGKDWKTNNDICRLRS